MNTFPVRAMALALVAAAAVGCEDIPLLPTWDADWYVPLTSRGIQLSGPFGGSVPAGTSVSTTTGVQSQALDGAVGGVLDQEIRTASVIVTLTKTLAVDVDDTLFVAAAAADLTNPAATRIVVPMAMAAGDASVTDTVLVPAAGITMLTNTAANDGTLYVELRGRATWAGPGTLTVTPTDSIGMRLALLARIGVSR